MAELRQTSFAAGELSPTLWGRTDLPQYDHGLRRCYNFVIDQHGAAVFRPGFRYVSTCDSHPNVKLFALNVSEDESYLLVFSPNFVRIYPNGGPSFTELRTRYTKDDVPKLRFQQLGRGVLVFCPGMQIREIRGAGLTWSITLFHTDPQLSSHPKLNPVWGFINREEEEAAETKEGYIYAFTTVLYHVESQTYVETKPEYVVHQGWGVDHLNHRATRDENGNLKWPNGNPWQGRGNRITYIDVEKYPIRHIYIPPFPDYTTPPGYEHHSIRIYRAVKGSDFDDHSSVWGLVGESKQDPRSGDYIKIEFNHFSDADYTVPPRQIRGGLWDILTWRRGAVIGDDSVQHNPTVGAIHDQRLVLAASEKAPDKIWFSQVNSFDNFDLYPIPAPHHALTAVLGGDTLEKIVALVSHHKLMVFTDTNLWALDGGDGGPIATGNLVARIYAEVGAAPIQPLVLGSNVFFVSSDRRRIFRAFYDGRSMVYETDEVSIPSAHLFRQDGNSSRIRAWTISREPSATVWVALEDGKFVSFTYTPATGVMAFAQHETGRQGPQLDRVLDFATLRVGGEDRVYAVVRRRVGGFYQNHIEYLDSSYQLDGYKTYLSNIFPDLDRTTNLHGLDHLNGRLVHVVAGVVGGSQVVLGPFRVENGRVTFTLPTLPGEEPGSEVEIAVGLRYVGELELLDVPVEKLRVKTVSKVGWEVMGSRGLLTGEDFDHLTEWIQTTVTDVYGPSPSTGLVEVYIASSWNKHGRAVLRQPLPLPLTVLGVTREGKLGG